MTEVTHTQGTLTQPLKSYSGAYTYIHTHTHIYIYVCVCVCVYIYTHIYVFIRINLWQLTNNTNIRK